ncbi:c-type cytochrome [Novilysobacter arseniciresistens]|uniref:c-type cytochrome n=1 Tax=Novilysobacter arseniciresistens TaxID=1385522 RepID=UPI0009DCA916|nr:c-type cytochrome [Lysobacter arseniciresistens]
MSVFGFINAAGLLAAISMLGACDNIRPPRTGAKPSPVAAPSDGAGPVVAPAAAPSGQSAGFTPPGHDQIPDGPYGDIVRKGRDIFTDTRTHAGEFVGNSLSCGNCHLDAGRLANSAPLWGAYVRYPAYRSKTGQVNNYTERLQGCFMYSMNGTAPPAGSEVLVALETYSYWMAQGAPVGAQLPGAGYPKKFKPPQPPDYARGEAVFVENCALCHGEDGQGQSAAGRQVFPPLWGPKSYNWGAGMHQLDNAAGFIKANMPLGRGGSLSDQQAWDVAMFMNAQERPQDPRFTGNLADTRAKFHDDPNSLYGLEVDGRLLGSDPIR